MLTIELTTGQKVQVALIVVVLAIAGFMVFRSTRSSVDQHVNAWVEPWRKGVDIRRPISKTNPEDPKNFTLIYVFACYDGRLKITQFPNDPDAGRTLFAFEPATQRTSFNFYVDPAARLNRISDPYRHTLALAAYSAANGRALGLLAFAQLTAEQAPKEQEARQVMLDAVRLYDSDAQRGIFHSEMFSKLMNALEDYKNKPGDPGKDTPKADAARKVIQLAMDYMQKLEDVKSEAVEKYIAKMDGLLTSDQRAKLAEGGKQYAAQQARRGAAARRNTVAGGPAASRGARSAGGRAVTTRGVTAGG